MNTKPWFRRLIYVGTGLVWIAVMCFPLFAFLLAVNGQLSVGDVENSGVRVFLVHEDEYQGLGIQRSHRLQDYQGCSKSSIVYLLWKGQQSNLNTTYCSCDGYLESEEPIDLNCAKNH